MDIRAELVGGIRDGDVVTVPDTLEVFSYDLPAPALGHQPVRVLYRRASPQRLSLSRGHVVFEVQPLEHA